MKCAYSGGGLFVKIFTNQDIWGSGEAVDAIGGTYYLVQRIGKQISGKSPLNQNRFLGIEKRKFPWWRSIRNVCCGVIRI